ncbi:hypothetical protein DFH29DRAFT_1077305 [Suillus ampliporus]|nr:hypothetical protein DFH29DRAFT_1077305 [Suillus ampliporus]
MKVYANDTRNQWTREEAEDYEKFQKAESSLRLCFTWATHKSPAVARAAMNAVAKVASATRFCSMVADDSDTSRLTIWERNLVHRTGKPFPLRRYISKLFALSYHINALLRNVAYSFRMGSVLQSLTIVRIDPIVQPSTFNVSKDIIPTDLMTTPPVNYVGVSKLSCHPCHALFDAYNTAVAPEKSRYFIKDCHSKLYPWWSIPAFDAMDSPIRSQLAKEHFRVALGKLLIEKQKVHGRSDSIDMSATSVMTEFKDEEGDAIDELHALLG